MAAIEAESAPTHDHHEPVPFVDLGIQYRAIKPEIDAAVISVLESTAFVLGPQVEAFEEAFAAFTGTKHAVAVNSGTSALHLALVCAGVGPGDEVLTTAMTFIATAAAVEMAGARPVFVDVEPNTLLLDPKLIDAAVTERTKALLPVHLHGLSADLDPMREAAERHGLMLIEDAAQAHGAEYQGRRVGGFGEMGCFSFYPGKNLGAYGEGGAVVTNDDALAEELRLRRDWGAPRKYEHELKGFNYRMDGVQGAVLGVKMNYVEGWTEQRRRIASIYDRELAGCGLSLPVAPTGTRHVYHVYAVRSGDRDRMAEFLGARGISTGIHYPTPVHLQPAFADLGLKPGALPVTERGAAQVLSLPLFPEMTDAQIDRTVSAVLAWAETEEPGVTGQVAAQ